jgi:hypothetical protein
MQLIKGQGLACTKMIWITFFLIYCIIINYLFHLFLLTFVKHKFDGGRFELPISIEIPQFSRTATLTTQSSVRNEYYILKRIRHKKIHHKILKKVKI